MLKTILTNWLVPAIVITFVLLTASLLAPRWAGVLGWMMIFFIFSMAIFSVVRKQRKLFRENRISRTGLARNIFFEVTVILLTMIMAASLGRVLTEMAIQQFGPTLLGFAAGIVFGLVGGMGVGFLVKRTWGRLGIRIKSSST